MTIRWDVTREDHDLIMRIADRAIRFAEHLGLRDWDRQSMIMDLTAVHVNDVRLRLRELLDADDANFNHDVFGIVRHVDRTTGKLGECFVPRFS